MLQHVRHEHSQVLRLIRFLLHCQDKRLTPSSCLTNYLKLLAEGTSTAATMAEPQSHGQDRSETEIAAEGSRPQEQQSAPAPSSRPPIATSGQASTSEPGTRREVDVTAIGQFGVDVGGGESVLVPNPFGRAPTREEIYRALVDTGYPERADELADMAYADVTGTSA